MKDAPAENLRVECEAKPRIDGGRYIPPRWCLRFDYNGVPRKVEVPCRGGRPTAQEVLAATLAAGLGLTPSEALDIPIRE